MQNTGGHLGVEGHRTLGALLATCPVDNEVLRGRGHLQERGVTPTVIELLTCGNGKCDSDVQRSGTDLRDRPLGLLSPFVNLQRLFRNGHGGELVSRGFGDQKVARGGVVSLHDQDVRGFLQSARQGGHGVGLGVEVADGPVVGVGDGDGAVWKFERTQRMLQTGGFGWPVLESEVEQAHAHV